MIESAWQNETLTKKRMTSNERSPLGVSCRRSSTGSKMRGLCTLLVFTGTACRIACALSQHPNSHARTAPYCSSTSHDTTPRIISLPIDDIVRGDETPQKERSRGAGVQDRKKALRSMSSTFASTSAILFSLASSPTPSVAFDRTFPVELTDIDDKAVGVTIGQRSNSQQRKENAELSKKKLDQNLAGFNLKNDFLPSLTWGTALFLASGSRSNPLTTPLANILYDETEEKWLADRNAGLFSAPPLPFLFLLGLVFLVIGTVTQYGLLQIAEGDSLVCQQLAGCALIGGGFLEIGRIASGDKRMTRDEKDRAVQLNEEFNEFATNRLRQGGNCHRSDIVKSFRRYYAKYRQADSADYPLTDLEIEKLLRYWNANNGKAEMSSSGFYYGIQINTDADVFA